MSMPLDGLDMESSVSTSTWMIPQKRRVKDMNRICFSMKINLL